jgi:heptosyltransferase-3
MAQGRILIIRGGAIGDFILTLPVLAALRAHFPSAHLEVLGYRHIAELALAGGLVDDVRSIEARPLAAFFAAGGALAPELQSYFASFDIILSFLYDPDRAFADNVGSCGKAQFIAGPHRPDEQAGVHATEVFLKPLQRLAIFEADPVPRLSLGASTRPRPSTLAFHPGSGSERKNWPEPRWLELLRGFVASSPREVLLIGGEAEGDRLARLAAELPPEQVQCAQQLPLVDVARLLSACAGFVGHDSGISHLAAALGLPIFLLWGESNEAIWRPRGDRVRVMRGPAGLQDLPVATVRAELEKWRRRS